MLRLRTALMLSAAVLPGAFMAEQAEAQQVTSGIRGVITGPTGQPAANTTVIITDTRTGRTDTVTTNAQGSFTVTGLEVGGPYTVFIDSDTWSDERIEGLTINLNQTANINVQLTAGAIEEVVVTAAARVLSQLAIGPSSSYSLETLENLPSIDRDIRDTIRIDPRVSINSTQDDSISCLGGNNRFNSFTIDGVRTNDAFGLNASGFPSRNTLPIPFDSVRETAVEFSPFDVEYGQFTGCTINVVTKSGSNEFHGSAFGVMNSDGLTGKTIDGNQVIADSEQFRDWNWGADIGGPIIKDKLFFYAAYEETSDSDIQSRGPIGAGFASGSFLTLEEANFIQNILETTYGQDTGGILRNQPQDSRRILGRLDWFINENHRAAFTATLLDESNVEEDDFGFNGFAFRNNFEEEGSDVETYSLRVFSDWTDNFSTELRISRLDNMDIQDPLGGGEAQDPNPVTRFDIEREDGSALAISGPGFFRAANELNTQIDQVKIQAEYVRARHTYTFGYELDQMDVFNLFVPDSTGTIVFEGLDNFENGLADFISGSTSFSGDINDAAANFSRSIHSIYVQDEWLATEDLTITAGLRYDFYTSSDEPPLNPAFVDRYGFANTQAFDGLDIWLPRLGFTYEAPWEFYGNTRFRGGAGVFTGGDPTVWFSNAFTNFGAGVGSATIFDAPCNGPADLQVIDANGNFTGFPQCVFEAAQAEAQANNGPVDAIDPNFELPSVVRGSFGMTHFTDFAGAMNGFWDDWRVDLDIIHTRRRNAPNFIDLTLTQVGLAPDGRPLFNRIDPLQDGCDAVFLGVGLGFSGDVGPDSACSEPGGDQDTLLTNVRDGEKDGGATTLSILFNKQFQYETFNAPGTIDINLGYAFTAAKEVSPSTSSTAGSNVEEVALSVINNPPLANSQFTNRHNLTLSAIFRQDFFEDLTTSLGLFFSAQEGRPFSFVFDDDTTEDLFGDTDDEARQLLYVPTGIDDPLVDFSQLSQEEIDEFFNFIESSGLDKFAGQIVPRNEFRDPWFKDLDVRIAQEFPTPFAGHNLEFFVDIENFLNLIDDNANVLKRFERGDVGEGVPLVSAELSEDGNQFVFTSAEAAQLNRFTSPSVWAIQLGVRYRF